MKQSDHFRENAENCAQLAERATDEPTYLRYRRMEESWRALAEEQDWLDGNLRTSERPRIAGPQTPTEQSRRARLGERYGRLARAQRPSSGLAAGFKEKCAEA